VAAVAELIAVVSAFGRALQKVMFAAVKVTVAAPLPKTCELVTALIAAAVARACAPERPSSPRAPASAAASAVCRSVLRVGRRGRSIVSAPIPTSSVIMTAR
jgi:hypothetical protein